MPKRRSKIDKSVNINTPLQNLRRISLYLTPHVNQWLEQKVKGVSGLHILLEKMAEKDGFKP